MSITYNADEIFEIACRIELNGARFYRKASKFQADLQVAAMLNSLADMEDRHLALFTEMRAHVQTRDEGDTALFGQGEAAQYLQALADGHIFDTTADPSEQLGGHESTVDILKMAIGIEKESVVLYAGMRRMVPDGEGRDAIDEIIGQELGHVAVLSNRLKEITG